MLEAIFCQKIKVLAGTSNLCVGQNLVNLGIFLHFSQKVVGMTLSWFVFLLEFCGHFPEHVPDSRFRYSMYGGKCCNITFDLSKVLSISRA